MMIHDATAALQVSCLFLMLTALIVQTTRVVDLLRAIHARLEDEPWRESLRKEEDA